MTGAENGTEKAGNAANTENTENSEFEVWRQDDNGNRFLVSRHPDRTSAEAALAAIEAGVQHKQLYYVTRGSSSG